MDITMIKELHRTTNEREANQKLADGWMMLDIIRTGNKLSYVLVKQ